MKKELISMMKTGIKDPLLAIQFLKNEFLSKFKNKYILNFNGISVNYSIADKYSRMRFRPAYNLGRIHEPIIIKMIIEFLNNSSVFIDVGAHLGYFTCIAGKKIPKGKVYAFEIDQNTLEIFHKNIKLNKLNNVTTYNCAVSDKDEIIKIPKTNLPNGSFSIFTMPEKKEKYISIQSINLDNFFKNEKIQPDVLKIDVEGAELKVLKGMKKSLEKRNLILFIELHGGVKLKQFNTNSREVISFLDKSGYKVYEIMNHRIQDTHEIGRLKKLNNNSDIYYNTMILAKK